MGVLGKHIRDYLDTQCNFCMLSSSPPPDGLAAFRAFLKSEFCEENIEFWLACEDFKKTKSPQKLSSKAKKIYTDFIEKEAPKEVKGGKRFLVSAYFEHPQHQSEKNLKRPQIKGGWVGKLFFPRFRLSVRWITFLYWLSWWHWPHIIVWVFCLFVFKYFVYFNF